MTEFQEVVETTALDTAGARKQDPDAIAERRHNARLRRFEFLALPGEIRNKIYELLLVDTSGPIELHSLCKLSRPRKYRGKMIPRADRQIFTYGKLYVQVLRTCRQINKEASHFLYGTNVFTLIVNDQFDGWFDAPAAVLKRSLIPKVEKLFLLVDGIGCTRELGLNGFITAWIRTRQKMRKSSAFFAVMKELKQLNLSICMIGGVGNWSDFPEIKMWLRENILPQSSVKWIDHEESLTPWFFFGGYYFYGDPHHTPDVVKEFDKLHK
ncbi:hypothetical protein NA57DRAFT_60117 [Rhizodiscina lignyota]|uniref:F-box domain-containing protein n=1 Tax=Rhizodiscina lignyota TaxID=1504668 RepID=A0A9P4I756_9PEZI|nr:hypothetical protein NA57DRAFT_60117 [Rhizodiscina lignyota]